ncbi:UDP-N-acetylglucosamine 2-epimerase [Roseomonas harenae]|uniref:UDP-N-acetylglucosamine 2-epimerase n=1 Tax=Muricoccus harenae TaxID=2692566 RepID=UPI001F2B3DC5|nr:UDP-N-acetylglucosamine 2-epimerase [Roseomonas harenae]
MMACAELWSARRPALVVVAGDVDGTLAATLATRKLAIPVAHLEAGLRCGDLDMPEEINRRAVDAVSTLLWPPDEATAARLLAEGHVPEAAPPQPIPQAARPIRREPAPPAPPVATAAAAFPLLAPAPTTPSAGDAQPAPPPRLLLEAAPAGPQDIPASLAALLARDAPEAALAPSAALGSMVQALRDSAPRRGPGPAPSPERSFPLIASLREAIDKPPAPEPAPSATPGPAIARPMVPATQQDDRPRLLQEAGLSGNQTVPASVAALLARPPEAPAPTTAAAAPITSDVPLVEAALRAADPPAAPGPAGSWRLLEAGEAQPPLPKVVAVAPQSG